MLDMLEVCRCGWKMLSYTFILFSLQILVNNIDSLLSKKKKKKIQIDATCMFETIKNYIDAILYFELRN